MINERIREFLKINLKPEEIPLIAHEYYVSYFRCQKWYVLGFNENDALLFSESLNKRGIINNMTKEYPYEIYKIWSDQKRKKI